MPVCCSWPLVAIATAWGSGICSDVSSLVGWLCIRSYFEFNFVLLDQDLVSDIAEMCCLYALPRSESEKWKHRKVMPSTDIIVTFTLPKYAWSLLQVWKVDRTPEMGHLCSLSQACCMQLAYIMVSFCLDKNNYRLSLFHFCNSLDALNDEISDTDEEIEASKKGPCVTDCPSRKIWLRSIVILLFIYIIAITFAPQNVIRPLDLQIQT